METRNIQKENSSLSEKALSAISFPYRFVRNNPAPFVGAAAMALLLRLGTGIDGALNPELIQALRGSPHWWKWFTSDHSVTVAVQDHPTLMASIAAGMGALWGYAVGKKR